MGYSIGGSTASRQDSISDQAIVRIFTSTFDTKYENEPRKQRYAEQEIQENMATLFKTDADIGPANVEKDPKTENEKYAVEQFKKILTF